MNNQEIQIIVGILLLLVYVYCIRNNEGYRRRGQTRCMTKPVVGRRIYKRVRPFKRCGSGGRGFISELNRVITPIPRGRVPVRLTPWARGFVMIEKRDIKKAIYKNAKMGANYMVIEPPKDPRSTRVAIFFAKGASTATKPQIMSVPPGTRSALQNPPPRSRESWTPWTPWTPGWTC